MSELPILYQDDVLVAVNKPAGVMTHRSKIAERDAISAMEALRDQLGCWVYPVHRLDRATSGVLLFALNSETARVVQEQLTSGGVRKRYLAVTRGYAPDTGHIDRPLLERRDRITDKQAALNKPPQPAETSFETWARAELDVQLGRYPKTRFSLVEARPHTGRRHQIRRHLAGLSYPLIGDTSHGRGELNRYFRQDFNCHRLALASIGLELTHPTRGDALVISAPLSGSLARVCHDLFIAPHDSPHDSLHDSERSSITPGLPEASCDWRTDPRSLEQLLDLSLDLSSARSHA